ncbi:MAG: DICT sensory domain-containing protein [Leptolyngbyaceae cyanobacterium MO_188.B28]|nr:DICT sensory domain-containing protein [Leptolyngbyaceae cyanobacterium MO_188.B28]
MRSDSTLNQLKAALPTGQFPSSYGVYFKNTLVALCHALEDHILQNRDGSEDQQPLVLVTFQRGKWYLQEADRYFDLAQCSRRVAIAAVPDSGFASHQTSQMNNVSLVNLVEGDSFVNEWNLLILAPSYAAMVLCHELSEDEYRADSQPKVDTERKFYGLWTFDRPAIEAAATILIERMRPYDSSLADQLALQQQQIGATEGLAPADLSGVVSRIVTYLQSSQEQLVTVSRQTRDFWELEGQALRLNRNLTANKLQAFLRMARRVDERDQSNPFASLQVAALAETLGQLLDLPTIQLRRLRLAGLLFRIGLAEAPDVVFTQLPSDLDASGMASWRDRTAFGAQLLSAMPELAPVTQIVSHQLEYWNGGGRPEGLKGEDIPIEARILSVVAYFQELTQSRGDRPALSLEESFEKCQTLSGVRFDPALVDSLGALVRLTEAGLMQLPTQPSELPTVWLGDSNLT